MNIRTSCKIEGCGRPGRAGRNGKQCFSKGLCKVHYARQYFNGTTEPTYYAQLGQKSNPLYYTWHNMVRRCTRKSNTDFASYGGRGIKVCERWLGPYGFQNFYEDMGEKPDKHTLERVDNNGDYEPGNCVWATYRTQANNTRRNHWVNWQGKKYTVAELVRKLNLQPSETAYHQRLYRGWSVEKTFTTPLKVTRRAK